MAFHPFVKMSVLKFRRLEGYINICINSILAFQTCDPMCADFY